MKSDLHEIFSVLKDWSLELIKSVCGRAHARVHAQDMETCTQLGAKNKPSNFTLMKLDLYESWYDVQRGIKQAQKKCTRYVHACTCNMHKHA